MFCLLNWIFCPWHDGSGAYPETELRFSFCKVSVKKGYASAIAIATRRFLGLCDLSCGHISCIYLANSIMSEIATKPWHLKPFSFFFCRTTNGYLQSTLFFLKYYPWCFISFPLCCSSILMLLKHALVWSFSIILLFSTFLVFTISISYGSDRSKQFGTPHWSSFNSTEENFLSLFYIVAPLSFPCMLTTFRGHEM